jgi:hypothetical protein
MKAAVHALEEASNVQEPIEASLAHLAVCGKNN